jgi:hypothetical protein
LFDGALPLSYARCASLTAPLIGFGSSPSRCGPPQRTSGQAGDLPVPVQRPSVHARFYDHAEPIGCLRCRIRSHRLPRCRPCRRPEPFYLPVGNRAAYKRSKVYKSFVESKDQRRPALIEQQGLGHVVHQKRPHPQEGELFASLSQKENREPRRLAEPTSGLRLEALFCVPQWTALWLSGTRAGPRYLSNHASVRSLRSFAFAGS